LKQSLAQGGRGPSYAVVLRMSGRGLDFLVIGAAKAGTTSLHEYARTHPELYLPEAKEQLFFTRDEAYEAGWDEFAAVAFYGAPEDRRWGMVTPHYLAGPVLWRESTAAAAGAPAHIVTARRIASTFPDVKLIALLRDPVERALSSYWQAVVLGDEQRGIDQALEEELSEEALDSARAHPTDGHMYVVGGEYGRLLAGYLEHFPPSQLWVGSTHVLDVDPTGLLREIWGYLGVDESHVPPNLGTRYQTRGTGRRIKALTVLPGMVRRTPGLRHAWNALPPGARRRARARFRLIAHRLDQFGKADDTGLQAPPDPRVLERLREHYEDDVELLKRTVGPVPGVTAGDVVPEPA
jgi:Sulfotransferase family